MKLMVEVIRTTRTPFIVELDTLAELESIQLREDELGDPTHDDIEFKVIRQMAD